jgi:hypothetical protein
MSLPNVRAKSKGSASAIGIRTSPRTNRNPYATGSVSGWPISCVGAGPLTSSGTSAMAGGVEEYVPPRPARALSFATPQAKQAYQSLKNTHSTNISEKKRDPTVAKLLQPKKKIKQGEEDDDVSIKDDKNDKDIDFVPITNNAMERVIQGKGTLGRDDIEHGIKLRHREAFMAKAFPDEIGKQPHANPQVQSGSMKTCRPQAKLDYIIHVLEKWEVGTEVNKLPPGPHKDRLLSFP